MVDKKPEEPITGQKKGEIPASRVKDSNPKDLVSAKKEDISASAGEDDGSRKDAAKGKEDSDSDSDSGTSDTSNVKDGGSEGTSSDSKKPPSGPPVHKRITASPMALVSQMSGLTDIDSIKLMEVGKVIKNILDTFHDPKRVISALGHMIKQHPYRTAFITISLILILNPVMLAGFGSGGVVAGSLAAAWQATMGSYIAAGSAFAILQSIGATSAVLIPMLGVGGLALTILGPTAAVTLNGLCSTMVEKAKEPLEKAKEPLEKAKVWFGELWREKKD